MGLISGYSHYGASCKPNVICNFNQTVPGNITAFQNFIHRNSQQTSCGALGSAMSLNWMFGMESEQTFMKSSKLNV
ncbi:hypothetical protein SUGI_0441010 [Cryptomeria japonica]|nr:hypothetical protein SUGI_0441010 [Cryptomeria japonica]